jgi:hypothetical protein
MQVERQIAIGAEIQVFASLVAHTTGTDRLQIPDLPVIAGFLDLLQSVSQTLAHATFREDEEQERNKTG